MRLEDRELMFICHTELRKGIGSGASEGKKTIHRKMQKANIYFKKSLPCHADKSFK